MISIRFIELYIVYKRIGRKSNLITLCRERGYLILKDAAYNVRCLDTTRTDATVKL